MRWPTLFLIVALQGCATQPAQVPASPAPAVVQGLPADVRYWGDDSAAALLDWRAGSVDEVGACCAGIVDRPHNYLAISSGGVEGAFGAGVIVGWTAAGTRPEFQLVTGVSAGALIAPFAFLGPEYDGSLREIYSRYSSKDLVERRGLIDTLKDGAAMDTTPLRHLIDQYLGGREIERIAEEGRKGRRLLIGTTSLNAERPVVWDLTKIAASGVPSARQLIGDIILASAAMPGMFPPVRISIEAGGVHYDEWHVDGGVASQLFLTPAGVDWQAIIERLHIQGQPQVYVVRNARAYPKWTAVREMMSPLLERSRAAFGDEDAQPLWQEANPGISSVFMRSMASMLRTRGFHDAVRLYLATQDGALGFNLARIPEGVTLESNEFYDRAYMQGLFEHGFVLARDGYPWLRGEAAPGK